MRVILNASPIIAFFEELESPGTLLLLKKLGYDLQVPQAVRDEIVKEPSASLLSRYMSEGEISCLPSPNPRKVEEFRVSHPALGAGESEVILNALDVRPREEVVCVLDEGPPRSVAQALDIPVTGTIGVLNLLRDANLITEAEDRDICQRLLASSFRIGRGVLRRR